MLALIFLMAIVPALWAPAVPLTWSATDKWLHGLTFMLLALWYTGQYAPESYWRIAVGLSAYGALITTGTVFAAEPSRSAAFRAFDLARDNERYRRLPRLAT